MIGSIKYAARGEWWLGLVFSALGLGALAVASYVVWQGWNRLFGLVDARAGAVVIPDNLWELAVATTGATILLLTMSTGLFQVGQRFFDRAAGHSRVMALVYRIQISVRIALTCDGTAGRQALAPIAQALLDAAPEPAGPSEELTALPGVLKELAGLVEKLRG